MDVQEQGCWLALVFKSGVSSTIVHKIITTWCQQQGKTLTELFNSDIQTWRAIFQFDEKVLAKLTQAKEHITEQIAVAESLVSDTIQMLTVVDEMYPKHLKLVLQDHHIPPILFARGNLQLLKHITIAIIGSRHARIAGVLFAYEAASYLAEHGANIISGYARGVDNAAYEGAISTSGCTTVVLPNGINTLSKVQKQSLFPLIETGTVLLLSQFHPTAPWLVSRAMTRNRVITGLAQVVIVAEANTQGGTWDAAQGALKQEKPLYVCQFEGASLLLGNQALLENGGRPLYWTLEMDNSQVASEEALSIILHESILARHRQQYIASLSQQLSRLLREHSALVW